MNNCWRHTYTPKVTCSKSKSVYWSWWVLLCLWKRFSNVICDSGESLSWIKQHWWCHSGVIWVISIWAWRLQTYERMTRLHTWSRGLIEVEVYHTGRVQCKTLLSCIMASAWWRNQQCFCMCISILFIFLTHVGIPLHISGTSYMLF